MNRTISMSSLSVPHRLTSDSLLILIPYDRDEPANVYTVEYRTVFGNDASIGSVSHSSYFFAIISISKFQLN